MITSTFWPPAVGLGFRQVRSFVLIGVVSTVTYVALFAVLRGTMPAAVANALALLVTAVGNTAANRRLTFGVRGRTGLGRHHAGGLVALGVALVITTASVDLLQAVAPRSGRSLEIGVLVAANVLATGVRFLLLRSWIEPGQRQRAAS